MRVCDSSDSPKSKALKVKTLALTLLCYPVKIGDCPRKQNFWGHNEHSVTLTLFCDPVNLRTPTKALYVYMPAKQNC